MEKNLSHLYVITNKINNKKYFGMTTSNPATKRWIGHKTVARRKKNKSHLTRSMNKYGFENFEFEVLISHPSREYIGNLEKECIQKYQTQNRDIGYNRADGGEINVGFTIPSEVRRKRSKEMQGELNHFYGRRHSDETKYKISVAKKGKKLSEETKAKMKGRPSSLKGVTGENHPCFNRVRPESERKDIQRNMPHRLEVEMIDPKTEKVLMKFMSKKEAGKWVFENGKSENKNVRSIASTITKATRSGNVSYGYKWREVNERQSTIENTQ